MEPEWDRVGQAKCSENKCSLFGNSNNMSEKALEKFLDIFIEEILPLTEKGVDKGNKIFGAAILKKDDFSLVVAGSNNEIENPIWHGETHTLKKFYEINKDYRPSEKDCIFLSSHEPCSLCLSAITFSGFDNPETVSFFSPIVVH